MGHHDWKLIFTMHPRGDPQLHVAHFLASPGVHIARGNAPRVPWARYNQGVRDIKGVSGDAGAVPRRTAAGPATTEHDAGGIKRRPTPYAPRELSFLFIQNSYGSS